MLRLREAEDGPERSRVLLALGPAITCRREFSRKERGKKNPPFTSKLYRIS